MVLLYILHSRFLCGASILACWFSFFNFIVDDPCLEFWVFFLYCCCKLVQRFLLWVFGHIGVWVMRFNSFPPFVIVKFFGHYYLVTDFLTIFDASSLPLVCTFFVPWFVGGVLSASHLSRQWYSHLEIDCCLFYGMMWLLFQIEKPTGYLLIKILVPVNPFVLRALAILSLQF